MIILVCLSSLSAPEQPVNVVIVDVKATEFTVKWTKSRDRPGNTSYIIDITATAPVPSKTETIYGEYFLNFAVF